MIRKKTTNLVKIEQNKYTFYKDKKKVISVEATEPFDAENLEFYRKHPEYLVLELMGEKDPELA
jgi:hypothetical protein